MSRPWKQHWRFEWDVSTHECKIFLNDQQWTNILSFKIEGGFDADGTTSRTVLTFSVLPDDVQVSIAGGRDGDMNDGLFHIRRLNGESPQALSL